MALLKILSTMLDMLLKITGSRVMFLAIAVHYSASYVCLMVLGETGLTSSFFTFTYWYMITTLTIGYGDLSPQTDWGRMFTSFWVATGGILLISTLIGWITSLVVNIWRKRMKGVINYENLSGHTMIVGWHGDKTERMINLLINEQGHSKDKIIICDDTLSEHPLEHLMPVVMFVHGEAVASPDLLKKAGAKGAARIIVSAKSDEQTLAVTLALNKIKSKTSHLVAHFNSSETASLAKEYVSKIEIASSMTTEMMVRSVRDPGTSEVIFDLLNINDGATLFSHRMKASMIFNTLASNLLSQHSACLIAVRNADQVKPDIANKSALISAGDEVFYIAATRLPEEAFL